jgi:hypothetical protein
MSGVTPGAEERARALLERTELFDELGLGSLASSARMVARDALDALAELDSARSTIESMQRRHDEYVRYHAGHCFNRDGTTKSGIGTPAPARSVAA